MAPVFPAGLHESAIDEGREQGGAGDEKMAAGKEAACGLLAKGDVEVARMFAGYLADDAVKRGTGRRRAPS